MTFLIEILRRGLHGPRFVCTLVAIHLLAGVLPAVAEDVVARKFGVGPGPNSVGRAQTGEGSETDGPQAIYAGKNGEIYLLDQVNGRILNFDGRDTTSPTRSLTLPSGIEPTDMIATDGGVIVWDGKPIALEAKGDGLTRSLTVSRDAGAAADDTVLSMFGQTGSQQSASAEDAKASATRAVNGGGESYPSGPIKKSVATRGAGPVAVTFTPNAERTAMDIVVASKTSSSVLAKLRLQARDPLGTVELLEIDKLGRLYVLAEVVPSGRASSPRTFVARFAQNSTFEGTFVLPLKPDIALARRFVTVSPDGDVYFLRTRQGVVDVIGVGFTPVTKAGAVDPRGRSVQPSKAAGNATPTRTADAAAAKPVVGRPPIAAVGPLTRQRVVETAFGFEGLQWQVTPATYGQDPDTHCSGFDRIRRPGYLRGQLGGVARGVPYCWGCSGSLAQFASRIERGSLAGNVCTKDDPRRDVAGVDCSSFVSATWGLSTHFTTAAIPSIAAPIDDPWSMRPGDVFNKPNSHVMLFLGYTPDRKVQVIEAATGGCNGRDCRNVYALGSLLGRGYVPRRFRGLEADASAVAVASAPPPALNASRIAAAAAQSPTNAAQARWAGAQRMGAGGPPPARSSSQRHGREETVRAKPGATSAEPLTARPFFVPR